MLPLVAMNCQQQFDGDSHYVTMCFILKISIIRILIVKIHTKWWNYDL